MNKYLQSKCPEKLLNKINHISILKREKRCVIEINTSL